MRKRFIIFSNQAQTAIEYMLLLGVVTAIVLVGFKTYLKKAQVDSEQFYNKAAKEIVNGTNPCGNGKCNCNFESYKRCPVDCDKDSCKD